MPEDVQQDVVELGDEDVQVGKESAHEVVLSAASLRIEALEAQGKVEAAAAAADIPTSSWWPSPQRPWCPRAGRCSHALGNRMFPMLARSQRRSSRGR